jgi:hypothetical protein
MIQFRAYGQGRSLPAVAEKMDRKSGARQGHAALGAVFLLVASATALGQGAVETEDGLRLTLSADGAVDGLAIGGVERAAASVPSGFAYRELPEDAALDAAPNGSFESGGTSPASWTWANEGSGSWSWDGNVAFSGSRSLRLDLPGISARRSPALLSSPFPIRGNTPYVLTCQIRTAGLTPFLNVYVIEQDASGNAIQRGVSSESGTADWHRRSLSFVSSPRAASASFKVVVSSGYGTAWLDDVRLVDVFAGAPATPMRGAVSIEEGVLRQGYSGNGLELDARFTGGPEAIRVDATLTDTTGRDRAIELTFRLPLAIAGWIWDDDFVTPRTIAVTKRYENLDEPFATQTRGHTHSVYPFATVRDPGAALSLAIPMGPLMSRFAYDDVEGFRVTWDLGLSAATTKAPSRATVSFWIYTHDAKWGMRSAAEKYYFLNPSSFTSAASAQGAWVLANRLPIASVPGWEDFGWAYHEQSNELKFDNDNGITALHYVSPVAWGIDFPGFAGQPRPPYSTLIAALEDELATARLTEDRAPAAEMARSVFDTAPWDENGLQQLDWNGQFWRARGLQNYPMLPDPDIPGSRYGIVRKYSVDDRIAAAQDVGRTLNGIFLDNIGLTFANVESYRKPLWAYLDTPLSFSYATGRVTAYSGDAIAKFCAALRAYLHGKGMVLMGSSSSVSHGWFAHVLDVVGGEAQGADPLEKAYTRRTFAYGKPWSNLFVPANDEPPGGAEVLAYLRQALFLGYFPGMNGVYWDEPSAYERDRGLFRTYVPLIRTVANAGWRPVPEATPSDQAVLLERFDDGISDTWYLTAHNPGATSKTVQITVDAAALGQLDGDVSVRELLTPRVVAATRAGIEVRFPATLGPGETRVYAVTAPRPSPERRPARRVEPRR